SGTFSIAFADDHQSRSLDLFDVLNRRTLPINSRIVVDRRTEEWNHPLVDQVLAVVTLQIDNTSASYRTAETVRLRDRPHCHITAVTPTGDTQSCRIDRILGDGGIYSGENVAQVAASKVFHVGTGKFFSLAVASARIRQQDVEFTRANVKDFGGGDLRD